MTTITCKVPEALNAKIVAQAKRRRVSKSAIVREALEKVVAGDKRKPVRAIDLVRDLVGSVDGPSDLSTNPKYMEGFGA